MDVSRIHKLGWNAKTDLKTGLRRAFEDFKTHQPEKVLGLAGLSRSHATPPARGFILPQIT